MRTTLREGLPEVLVVHERPGSTTDLAAPLQAAGYAVRAATAGEEAAAAQPAVVLVDVGEEDLLPRLRETHPAAIVIGLGPEDRRVRALASGCDLFLSESSGPDDLVATVRAALRLLRRVGDRGREAAYDDGVVRIDTALRQVEVAGRPVPLTPLEFRLLMALVRGRDRVVSRDELLEVAWQRSGRGDGDHVKLYVHYLRRKLNEHAGRELIQTVRGFGYRWLGAQGHERPGPTRRFRRGGRAAP